MTATYRRSKARKKADRTRKRTLRHTTTPNSENLAPLTVDYFTPTSPEPAPIYNFIEDWNRGVVPSNSALLRFFDSWKTSPILTADSRLSTAGRSLVVDLRELGSIFARIIRERNSDELIQRFIGHLRLAGRIIRHGQRSGRVTVVEDISHRRRFRLFGRRDAQIRTELADRRGSAKKDAQDLLTLGQLMTTSTDFRSIVAEMQSLIKQAINLSPQQTKSKVTDTEEAPRKSVYVKDQPTDDMAEFRRRIEKTADEISIIRGQIGVRKDTVIPEQRVPSMEFYPAANYATELKGKEPLIHETDQTSSVAPTFPQSTPQSTSAQYYRETPTTEHIDEINQLLDEARSTFRKLADNKNFRDAIDGIYDVLIRWQTQVQNLPGTVLPTDLQYDANSTAAQQDLLNLMERFASGVSIKPLLKSLADIRGEAARDYELLDFLRDWRAFLVACTSDKDYLEHQEYMNRGRYLLERASEYSERKYRKLFQENMNSWSEFIQGWQNDKLTTEVGRIISRIVSQDIFGQSEGGGTTTRGILNFANVQTSLLGDFQNVILPAILRELYELPLPHMEWEQGPMKVALDNVILPASLFAPAILELYTSNKLRLTPRERLMTLRTRTKTTGPHGTHWRSEAHLTLAGMKGDINNIRFAMARTSWPRIRDRGTADVRVGGKGMSISLDISTDIGSTERRFNIEPVFVRVKVSKLALKFYDINHDTFFAVMRPYLQALMKSRIERTLCDRIVTTITQVNRIANRMAKATLINK